MAVLSPAFAITAGLIVIIAESTAVHPDTLSVTRSLYVVVLATTDVMVGLEALVLLSRVFGDHKYVKLPDPPLAAGIAPKVIVAATGIQNVWLPPACAMTVGTTLTVLVAVPAHPEVV